MNFLGTINNPTKMPSRRSGVPIPESLSSDR